MTVPQAIYLSVHQVAERLAVSADSIYRWRRKGGSPKAVKLGPGSVRWRLADVEQWEAARTMCFALQFEGQVRLPF